jgi:hypothetical protein
MNFGADWTRVKTPNLTSGVENMRTNLVFDLLPCLERRYRTNPEALRIKIAFNKNDYFLGDMLTCIYSL